MAGRLKVSVEEIQKDLEKRDLVGELSWNIIRTKVFDLIIQEAKLNDRA